MNHFALVVIQDFHVERSHRPAAVARAAIGVLDSPKHLLTHGVLHRVLVGRFKANERCEWNLNAQIERHCGKQTRQTKATKATVAPYLPTIPPFDAPAIDRRRSDTRGQAAHQPLARQVAPN